MLASQLLGPYGLQIYLYLAANADGWEMAFSPTAIEQDIGLKQSTCRDHLKDLIKFGYLVQKRDGSNCYDFHERPNDLISTRATRVTKIENGNNLEPHGGQDQRHTFTIDSDNREINNNTNSSNKAQTNNEKVPEEESRLPDKFVF